ncbi:Trehalose-phosphatase domain containing protein, partial [Tylopilus felleus]
IVSGRYQAILELHLGHIKHLDMSVEHGGFIRERQTLGWVNFTEQLDMGWMDEVAEIFRYHTERTTGSHIDIKKSPITGRAILNGGELFQCRQCQDLLENHKRPIKVFVGKKNLEVRLLAVNKVRFLCSRDRPHHCSDGRFPPDRQADSTPSTIRIPRPLAPPSPQRLSEHVPGHHHRGLKLLRHALENNERSVHHLVQVRDYTATLNQRAYSARVITGYFLQRSRA